MLYAILLWYDSMYILRTYIQDLRISILYYVLNFFLKFKCDAIWPLCYYHYYYEYILPYLINNNNIHHIIAPMAKRIKKEKKCYGILYS